jgi:hypothetical protein
MHIELATLCHSAVSRGDNLSILEAYSRIIAPKYPHKFPPFTVAARLRFESDEIGDHSLTLTVRDANRRILGQMKIEFALPSEMFQPTASLSIVFPVSGADFHEGGECSIEFSLNNQAPQSVPFYVHLAS